MGRKLEQYLDIVNQDGLNTDKAAVFGSTVSVDSLTTTTATSLAYPTYAGSITDYDAQAATLTVAGIAGGTVTQNSKTGASTLTTPTGAQITAAFGDVAGTTIDVIYHNRGNQTSTITAGASGVTLAGATVAIATLKTAQLRFVNTGASAWTCYVLAAA